MAAASHSAAAAVAATSFSDMLAPYRLTVLRLGLFSFNSLTATCLAFFHAQPVGDWGARLWSYPSVDVGSARYRAYLPVVSIVLASVSCLGPLALAMYLRRLKRGRAESSSRLRRRLGAGVGEDGHGSGRGLTVAHLLLLAPFLPQYWWFGVYVLARRLSLLLLYTFVPGSTVFTALTAVNMVALCLQLELRPYRRVAGQPAGGAHTRRAAAADYDSQHQPERGVAAAVGHRCAVDAVASAVRRHRRVAGDAAHEGTLRCPHTQPKAGPVPTDGRRHGSLSWAISSVSSPLLSFPVPPLSSRPALFEVSPDVFGNHPNKPGAIITIAPSRESEGKRDSSVSATVRSTEGRSWVRFCLVGWTYANDTFMEACPESEMETSDVVERCSHTPAYVVSHSTEMRLALQQIFIVSHDRSFQSSSRN